MREEPLNNNNKYPINTEMKNHIYFKGNGLQWDGPLARQMEALGADADDCRRKDILGK